MSENCSTLALQAQEPLLGTASRNAFHFVLSIPKREWLSVIEEMEGSVGTLANLIKPLKDQAMLSLKNGSDAERGTLWLFPHGYRFNNLPESEYPRLIEQALNGNIKLPYEEIHGEKFILLCTHGKRDACCAKYGTAFFNEFSQQLPDKMHLWEVSHLGGHRFAATLVVQPLAHWYGNLRPENIPDLVASIQRNHVLLSHYRGHAAYPPPLQVAEAWGWEQLLQHCEHGKVNLVNPHISLPHADVEVSIHEAGFHLRALLKLAAEKYDFVADCSGAMKDRLIWHIKSVEIIENGSTT